MKYKKVIITCITMKLIMHSNHTRYLMDIMRPISQITLSCISYMFIEMIFINCHSCVIFVMKSMSINNDKVNYDKIIIQ